MLMRTILCLLLVPTMLSGLTSSALASPGELEINQTCAIQSGCFAGDAPGYPVTISARGAYRLTGSLNQTAIPGFSTPVNAIEIQSSDVRLDLGGFTISCSNPITGNCFGSAVGVAVTGVNVSGSHVSNGDVVQMPGGGMDLSAGRDVVVQDVRAMRNSSSGIRVGAGARIVGCTMAENGGIGLSAGPSAQVLDSLARDNGGVGIQVGAGALVARNVSSENTGAGIATGNYSTITGNTALSNASTGIIGNDGSTVADNTVADNLSNGISVGNGSNVHGNTASFNNGFGITLLSSGYRGNVIMGNSVGTVSTGGTNLGGNSCDGSLTCP